MVERRISEYKTKRIKGWVRNTTLDAKKIADYFGVSVEFVTKICVEERPWQKK